MADLKKLNVNGTDYDLKDLYSRTTLETIKQTLLTLASKADLGEMEEEVGESIESLKTTFSSIDGDTKKTIDAILAELNDPSSELKTYLDELVIRLQGLDGTTVIEYLESEIDRVTEVLEAMTADSTVVGEEDDRTIKDAIDSIEEGKETLEDLIKKVGEKIDDAGSIQIKDTKSIHTVEDKTWIITPEVELFTVYDINKVNISKIALISPLDNETEIGEGESIRITGDDTKVKSKLLIEGENLHMVDVKATNVENGVNRAISLTNRQDISVTKITYDVEFEVSPVMPPDDVISNISISFVMKEEFKDNKFEDESSTELNLGVYSENASYVSSIALSGTGISGSGSSYTASVTDSLKITGTLTINGNNLVASKFTKDNIKVSNVASGITITVGDITYTSAQKVTAPITITATSYASSKAGTITVDFVNSSASFVVTSSFVDATPSISSISLQSSTGSLILQNGSASPSITLGTSSSYVGTSITNRSAFSFRLKPNGTNLTKLTSATISSSSGGTFTTSGTASNYITVNAPAPASGVTTSKVTIQFKYNSTVIKTVAVTINWGAESYTISDIRFILSGKDEAPPYNDLDSKFSIKNNGTFALSSFGVDINETNLKNNELYIQPTGSNVSTLPTLEVVVLRNGEGMSSYSEYVYIDHSLLGKYVIEDLLFNSLFSGGIAPGTDVKLEFRTAIFDVENKPEDDIHFYVTYTVPQKKPVVDQFVITPTTTVGGLPAIPFDEPVKGSSGVLADLTTFDEGNFISPEKISIDIIGKNLSNLTENTIQFELDLPSGSGIPGSLIPGLSWYGNYLLPVNLNINSISDSKCEAKIDMSLLNKELSSLSGKIITLYIVFLGLSKSYVKIKYQVM